MSQEGLRGFLEKFDIMAWLSQKYENGSLRKFIFEKKFDIIKFEKELEE